MIKHFLIVLLLVSSNSIFSQSPGIFGQKINIKEYQGKRFELEVALKSESMETGAGAGVLVMMKNGGNKIVYQYFSDKPITLNEWKIYTVKGKIAKDATSFILGGLIQGKGIYYFDDFKLQIQTENNKTIEFPLKDNDFENDSTSMEASWLFPQLPMPKVFKIQLSQNTVYSGKQALMIDGSEKIKINNIGSNDSVGKFMNVNGINLYYEVYGKGQPLLLLHGNQQSIAAFTYQIPEFAKHFKVIAVDTRGQGKSSENGEKYTYDLFADDMNAFLDSLKLDSVDILGWSDGGNTALIMAMKYPDKVKRIVTMGACIFIDSNVVSNEVIKEVKKRMENLKSDTSPEIKNSVRLYNLLITQPNHSFDDLKKISCPVLVMAGENDIIKEGHTKGIAANIKRSTLFIAPKQTHEFPVENPKEFNKIVLDFLMQI